MIKTYKVTRGLFSDWEMTVVIDHEKANKHIKEMVEFWHGWEKRMKDNNDNYTSIFLKQLGFEVFYQIMSEGYNLTGILYLFSEGHEGWCRMDGTFGITIISVDESDIDEDDFSFETLEE